MRQSRHWRVDKFKDKHKESTQSTKLCLVIPCISSPLKMSPTKRALLIASPFKGLLGPLNDVQLMADVLSKQGFQISYCCGQDATRNGILDAWRRIIHASSSDDAVVIYYSGHGGIVEASVENDEDDVKEVSEKQSPWRYQFLVPIDYRSPSQPDVNGNNDFGGILDVEIAHLLHETTNRTRNVTTIFDCCHSGHIAREPTHPEAMPRKLPKAQYAAISEYVDRVRAAGQLPAEAHLDVHGNPHAVRIAASSDSESAWEYQGQGGKWVGSMTQALCKVLQDAFTEGSEPVSWRTMLLRVRELVHVDFPHQTPQAEGPDKRLLFSLKEARTDALPLYIDEDDVGIIHAGRASGVRENNVYALMPLGAQQLNEQARIGTATVTYVIGLKAVATLSLSPGKAPRKGDTVLAFLVHEALYEWPVDCPEGLNELKTAIGQSKYLRVRDAQQDSSSLAKFWQDGQYLVLSTGQNVQLASRQISDKNASSWIDASSDLVKRAEQLARAQHLEALTCDSADEKLNHKLAVTFGTVKMGKSDRVVERDGTGFLIEQDRIYISLKNNGTETIYVSTFDISVTGKISSLNIAYGEGVELPPGRTHVLGARPGLGLKGLPVTWAKDVPKVQPVNERLVLILTDSHVDLKYLADANYRGGKVSSSLEKLAYCLANGELRDITDDISSTQLRYDTLHIPYTLNPLVNVST